MTQAPSSTGRSDDESAGPIRNVLFLCTGNSARSILAESILNHWGRARFKAWSAGSHPKGAVNPLAIALLEQMRLPTEGLRSKSWAEFATPDAPHMHYVFTVCDAAAGEVCPIWPGHPITAHWSVPDPAAVEGPEAERMVAFRDAFRMLERRIQLFLALRHGELSRAEAERRVEDIGRLGGDTERNAS